MEDEKKACDEKYFLHYFEVLFCTDNTFSQRKKSFFFRLKITFKAKISYNNSTAIM